MIDLTGSVALITGAGSGLGRSHATYLSQLGAHVIVHDIDPTLIDETVEVTTRQLSDDVAIDYAPDGAVVGIEVLDASEHVFRGDETPAVTLENLIARSA